MSKSNYSFSCGDKTFDTVPLYVYLGLLLSEKIVLYIGNIKIDICHRSLKNNDTDQSIDALFQCDHFVKLE